MSELLQHVGRGHMFSQGQCYSDCPLLHLTPFFSRFCCQLRSPLGCNHTPFCHWYRVWGGNFICIAMAAVTALLRRLAQVGLLLLHLILLPYHPPHHFGQQDPALMFVDNLPFLSWKLPLALGCNSCLHRFLQRTQPLLLRYCSELPGSSWKARA